ncbi:MAG: hypothetical protein Q9187_008785, partial [Circinaria calcarea]
LLAWNGGGISNFTEIINKGKPVNSVKKVDVAHQLEDFIDAEIAELKSKFAELRSHLE